MIAEELKVKTAKAIAAKERKANKGEKVKNEKGVKSEVKDEFDMMADTKEGGLSDSAKKMKQAKLNFKPKKEVPEAKKGNPWSDSDGSEDLSGSDIDGEGEVAPRERAAGRRAATTKPTKYALDESESDADLFVDTAKNKLDSSSEVEVSKPKAAAKKNQPKKAAIDSSEGEDENEILAVDSDSEDATAKDEFDVSDSDDGGGFARKISTHVSQVKKPPPKKLTKSSDLFTDMMAAGGEAKKVAGKKVASKKPSAATASKKLPAPSKKSSAATSKKKKHSSSEDERHPTKKSKSTKMSRIDSESGSDFADGAAPPPREKAGGRSRAPVSYQGLDEESDSDF